MTISVIIVSYNVRSLLEACLRSVISAAHGIAAEVIVVDNCSNDDTVSYLQPLFPSMIFIANRTNSGFSAANNQGIVLSKGRFLLFLNPDTEVPEDCFSKCLEFLDDHPDAGALGVRMINAEGMYLKESKRGFPTPAASFFKLFGMSSLFPRSAFFSRYYMGALSELETHPVDVLSGAFMMVRKAVLDQIGGFDERFFMYAEDIDLSYRIIQAGYKNYYFPAVTILHHKGASTKKDFRYVKMFYRAMSQFVKKHYGNGVQAALLDGGIWLRAGIETLKTGFRKN